MLRPSERGELSGEENGETGPSRAVLQTRNRAEEASDGRFLRDKSPSRPPSVVCQDRKTLVAALQGRFFFPEMTFRALFFPFFPFGRTDHIHAP